MALGLLRLIVGVGVRAAVAQRRGSYAHPPPRPGPTPLVAPLVPLPPVSAPGTLASLAALPPPRTRVSNTGPILTGILATFGVLVGALFIAMQAMVSASDISPDAAWHLGEGILGNTVVCILPSLALYALTGWLFWRNRRLTRVQALCDTHARLPIATLAQQLGTSDEMAQAIALDAVERGLIHARLDLEPGVILSGNAVTHAGRQWAGTCPRCSAPVSVVLAPGQPAICPYCRGALGVVG